MSRILFAVALFSAVVPGATLAEPPPIEAFGQLPVIEHVVLSPTGTRFAALRRVRGRPYLAVHDFSAPPDSATRFMELEIGPGIEEQVTAITWLNDELVGVELAFEGNRWGVPTQETRLIAIPHDLSSARVIPQPPRGTAYNTQLASRIIDYLPEDPKHLLMALDRSGTGLELGAYKVDVDTGEVTLVVSGDEFVQGYLADQQGRVRLYTEVHDKKMHIRVRKPDGSAWSTLASAPREIGFPYEPLAFSENPNVLLVLTLHEERVELFELDVTENRLGQRVYGHPPVDVTGIETDIYTRKVIGAHYAVDYPTIHYFDEQLEAVRAQVDSGLPDTRNSITSFDRGRTKFVILANAPRFPGTYYLFDKESLQLSPIGVQYAGLDAAALRDVEPVTYEARDGLVIPGYLTRPAGDPPFPMVVLPHGGPTARDYLAFDFIAQFLASRGYAVLQPNYRGSTGYGAQFFAAGMGQWGLAMQDDLEDAARAMVGRGIADAERIGIVGWSYGGYAALMGAVKASGLFSCAASGAGVTDIPRMLSESARFKFMTKNQPSVGHFKRDRDKLRDNSPINNVDAIAIPVLLVHGEDDLIVPVAHSKRLAAKLRKAGKPHELVILDHEGHGLSREENRIRFLREVEAFLAAHLGVRVTGS